MTDIFIVGRACRLPGAVDIAAFRDLLREGRCAVTEIPRDRWNHSSFLHPEIGTKGKAYTFAAGVLDDIWGFDLGVFGISPREAEQMDPQQRLLLKVVWEAIEDARLDPADLAGQKIGVFVGASSMDHGVILGRDPALSDAYLMTGNTLSLLANRISHAFDLRGPSFVIDTACSSAMVALDRAHRAMAQGEIDTAIVAGVNLLLNPGSFVGFCAARMLSPSGLCRSFSGQADGYVRAEGCVAVVLRASADAPPGALARIVATDTNADGYTVNVALPSEEGQFRLLRDLYGSAGVAPDALHFIEAHGTGTLVGDPIEAHALGRALGQHRATPLPIGSVKTNVGHLEPAAGLAGILKTLVAFEDRCLPPSLHADDLNPHVDFDRQNLTLVRDALPLPAGDELIAGVSSFGFGGVNSHCILASVDARAAGAVAAPAADGPERIFVTSAFCDAALRDLARAYADRFKAPDAMVPGGLIDQAWWGRGLHPRRLGVLARCAGDAAKALAAHAAGQRDPHVLTAAAGQRDAPVVFAYSGNGAQYAGMSRLALEHDEPYRAAYDRIDTLFAARTGWSLRDRLMSDTLASDLADCEVSQPLLLADQVAQTMALADRGLLPDAVIGHSAGELAAAWAAGALSLEGVVDLVIYRSRIQAPLAGQGTMAALQTGAAEAEDVIEAYRAAHPGDATATIVVAAINSPRSVTLVGTRAELTRFTAWAKATQRLACVPLPVNYPYHSPLQDACEAGMRALEGIEARCPDLPFFSSTRGGLLSDGVTGPEFWWQNMRRPVLFEAATQAALDAGYRVFLEVGPQPVLTGYLTGTAGDRVRDVAVTQTLSRSDPEEANPISRALLRAVLHGARPEPGAVFHPPSRDRWTDLPTYPWQNTRLRITDSPEISRLNGITDDYHPLLGCRSATTLPVWRSELDDRVLPVLRDHRVGRATLLPATAFAEMVFAAAARAVGTTSVEIFDLDLFSPLVLSVPKGVEVQTSVDAEARVVRVQSRPRLSQEPFRDHVKARYAVLQEIPSPDAASPGPAAMSDARWIYRASAAVGLDYGPRFRGVAGIARAGDSVDVTLMPGLGLGASRPVAGFDPVQVDCLLHGVIPALQDSHFEREALALLPVRMGRIEVFAPGRDIAGGRIAIRRLGVQSVLADITALDAAGAPVLRLTGLRLRAVPIAAPIRFDRHAFHVMARPLLSDGTASGPRAEAAAFAMTAALPGDAESDDSALLIEAATHQAVWEALRAGADDDGLYVLRRPDHPAEATLLGMLVRFGLARPGPTPEAWQIDPDCTLPDATSVALALLDERPDLIAQLSVLLRLPTALAEGLDAAATQADPPAPEALFGREALAALDAAERRLPARVLAAALDALVTALPAAAPARVGTTEGAAPVRALMRASHPGLTKGLFPPVEAVSGGARFDAVLLDDPSTLVPDTMAETLSAQVAPGGDVVVHCAPVSALRKVAGVTGPGSATPTLVPDRIAARLGELGLEVVLRHPLPDVAGGGEVLIARVPQGTAAEDAADAGEAAALCWAAVWATLHGPCRQDRIAAVDLILPEDAARPILARCAPGPEPAEGLAPLILAMRDVIALAQGGGRGLTVILPGGAAYAGGAPAVPQQHALWALLRTAMNEQAALRVTLIDTEAVEDCGSAAVAARLGRALRELPDETEIVLTQDGVLGLRVVQGLPTVPARDPAPSGTGWRLARPVSGRLDDLAWQPCPRPAPGAGEVEIEVTATGLNYRDVMWAMGLLPEEALETGFAGPTLGLECAGRVSRIGPEVTGLAVGDAVIAFGPACFASHLIAAQDWVVRLPAGAAPEAAAALPVACFTASYALETLARLRPSDTVLIHGGAGGVGLAAIAIAQRIGARVIATAGTPVKQALLRAVGVDHVLSSRNGGFADDVRRITEGRGVDVVLNSLAGQTMEQSLGLLRPFGRFLELGKQDYYTGTAVGLRPLKDNIAYFGIDIDTLLAARPDEARQVFAQALHDLGDARNAPLPYTAFDGRDVVEAFRLMQRSGHVGKIVVRPPATADNAGIPVAEAPSVFAPDPGGWQVVAGGLGGLGLLTAEYLALRGARRLALLGRSAQPQSDQTEVLDRIRALGTDLRLIACDITDRAALSGVLASLRRDASIAGVYHAAMVIEDQPLAAIDAESLARTLPVKTLGLHNLDQETRQDQPAAFVAFTSLAALIGNPGQAAYIAANAWQEALIAARAAQGLPAQAIALGAISDAGYAARDAALSRMLDQMAGGVPFTGAAAMQALGRLLTRPGLGPCATVTPMNWTAAASALRVLRAPSHAALRALAEARGRDDALGALRAELAALPQGKAVKRAIAFLRTEIAAILRVPEASLQPGRPLAEYGMDSLMGVELGLAAQAALGEDLPMPVLGESVSIERLAEMFVAHIKSGGETAGGEEAQRQQAVMVQRLRQQHMGGSAAEPVDAPRTQDALS